MEYRLYDDSLNVERQYLYVVVGAHTPTWTVCNAKERGNEHARNVIVVNQTFVTKSKDDTYMCTMSVICGFKHLKYQNGWAQRVLRSFTIHNAPGALCMIPALWYGVHIVVFVLQRSHLLLRHTPDICSFVTINDKTNARAGANENNTDAN